MHSTRNSRRRARTSEARQRISAGLTSLRSRILTVTFFALGLIRSPSPEYSRERLNCRALRRAAHLAVPRRRNRHAIVGIFVELVAQRTDRDAEDVGGMRAVAEAVFERLEDQIALDVGDGAADQRAR